MRQFLKYSLALISCIALASLMSYAAFYAFWFGVWCFHSVPAARACDMAGSIFLTPARLVYYGLGGLVDQTTALADPISYCTTNGIFFGTLLYACLRRVIDGRGKVPQSK